MEGFLSAVAFAIRATYQTSIQTSPCSLAFGRDMYFPTKYIANWKLIKQQRLKQMQTGRARENDKRLPWKYKPGDLVLIRHDVEGSPRGKMYDPTSGPYTVLRVLKSNLELEREGFTEIVSIRRCQPYHAVS